MLTQPVEVLELEYRRGTKEGKAVAIPVAPTCLAFQENDPNNFIVGCETGAVYTAARYLPNKLQNHIYFKTWGESRSSDSVQIS